MKRFYIHWKYGGANFKRVKAAVKACGGFNVREALQYGWFNQPKVVTFSAPSIEDANRICNATSESLQLRWSNGFLVSEKNW